MGFPDSESADVAKNSQSRLAINNRLDAGLTSWKHTRFVFANFVEVVGDLIMDGHRLSLITLVVDRGRR